jgi:hypothetical protein
MLRLLCAPLLLCGLVATTALLAADDPKPTQTKPKPLSEEKDNALLQQQRLASQYQAFEIALQHLAQRLEQSKRPEDQERAKSLKEALKKSGELAVDAKFQTLVDLLHSNKTVSIGELKSAMEQSHVISEDIQTILAMLLDDRATRLKAERERIEKLIKELERIIREQQIARAQTEAGKLDKNNLKQTQQNVTQATQNLAKAMGSKSGQGQGQPKQGQGQPKQGQGQPKQGQGQPKQNQPSQPGPETAGRKQVEEALGEQRKAEDNLDKDKKPDASNNQDEAIKKLEEARKKLEEILRQLREEEMQRLLAALISRCQMMLAIQIEVQEGTIRVEKAIAQNPDQHASRPEEQRCLQLSDREREIVGLAKKAIELLETEGSAVAFPEVFGQVRDDAENVARRLGKADVGTVTQGIEQDIINLLKEMIEALKKAQQNRSSQSNSSSSGKSNPKLIDLLAELKMIRSLQIFVNQRTILYGRQYQGEQANDPDIQRELGQLAERESKIVVITNNIARGKNR